MKNHSDIFSVSDRHSFKGYLGSRLSFDVLKAYESAFGSVQILAYGLDPLEVIISDFFAADDETKRKFCAVLHGHKVSPSALKTQGRLANSAQYGSVVSQ